MSLFLPDLVREIIRPTLKGLDLYSREAEILLLGTALTESQCKYLKQVKGCALGIYQMEPATHNDIWNNYLKYNNNLSYKVGHKCLIIDGHFCYSHTNPIPSELNLINNLSYATAMARVHYLRVKEKIPEIDTVLLAEYYKKYYNTYKGKANVTNVIPYFKNSINICQNILV